jgi:hypothetical protein
LAGTCLTCYRPIKLYIGGKLAALDEDKDLVVILE